MWDKYWLSKAEAAYLAEKETLMWTILFLNYRDPDYVGTWQCY